MADGKPARKPRAKAKPPPQAPPPPPKRRGLARGMVFIVVPMLAVTASGLDWVRTKEETQEMSEGPRWYGVAVGDGNFGVSRMWAGCYVHTDNPRSVAEYVAMSDLEPAEFDRIELSGNTETGMVALLPSDDKDRQAEYVVEVFPEDDAAWLSRRRKEVPFYNDLDSLVSDWRAY